MSEKEVSQDEADALLMEAVDAIAKVQNGYNDLSAEQQEYLKDAKSSIAAVALHLDGTVVMDLDLE